MMKKRWIFTMVAVFFFLPSFQESLAKDNMYSTVHVVTTKGQQVKLPNSVTGLDKEGKLITESVTWRKTSQVIVREVGSYEVKGKTESKREIKGIINVFSNEQVVKIAMVGDSITYGMNVSNRTVNSYPNQLGQRLGAEYQVNNYGNSGKTLIETGNDPYVRTNEYKKSLAYDADVVIIQLGTNDTKATNFKKIKNYITDYKKLINTYSEGNREPVIYISLPPRVFSTAYGISQSNLESIIPMIFEVADQVDVDVSIIDNFSETENAKELIPDGVHPDARGVAILANNVYHRLKGEQLTPETGIMINDYFKVYGGVNTTKNGSLEIQNLCDTNWVSFKNVELTGKELKIFASVPNDNTKVSVHRGNEKGEIIGEKVLTKTGNTNTYRYQMISLGNVEGIEDLTLTFERANTKSNIELVRLAEVDFQYDAAQPLEIATFKELETALQSNLTNLKLMDNITFTKNIQLKDDTQIDLNQQTMNLANYYIGKNESIGKKINLSLKAGQLNGTYGYGSVYTGNSTNGNYGINLIYENMTFDGKITGRHFSPNSTIIEKGSNQLTHSLASYNTLVYENKDLSQFQGYLQLYAAVPNDKTYVTIRKGSQEGEVVNMVLLNRTGNVNTYAYHEIELPNLSATETLYLSFERQGSNGTTELVRLAKVDF